MPRAFFTVTAGVPIAGNPPGKLVQILVDSDGHPTEAYWRKRLTDGDIAPKDKSSPSPAASASPPADPPASPESESEAPKQSKKKGS